MGPFYVQLVHMGNFHRGEDGEGSGEARTRSERERETREEEKSPSLSSLKGRKDTTLYGDFDKIISYNVS